MSATLGSLDGSQLGMTTVDLASATGATRTLTADQTRRRLIKTSGTASGSNDVVFPVAVEDAGMTWIVKNGSGQNIVCKVAAQTGVTIATGRYAILAYDGGADLTRVTADTAF
jgi:hypothetical protein